MAVPVYPTANLSSVKLIGDIDRDLTMGQGITFDVPKFGDPEALLKLEQAAERISALIPKGESAAWELGDLLNTIESQRLVRSTGDRKCRTWLLQAVPAAKGKDSVLYRFAQVAAAYSREQVELWGTNKLEYLMVHDRYTRGKLVSGDPADRDIDLFQSDGSIVTKKFRDCSCRDLRRSNQLRGKAKAQRSEPATQGSDAEKEVAHPEAPRPPAMRPKVDVFSITNLLAVTVLAIVVEILFGSSLSTFLDKAVFATVISIWVCGLLIFNHYRRKARTPAEERVPVRRRSRRVLTR